MLLTRDSVELLAPVGTWDVLEAAIEAGANAVYLGGKRFNMRMFKTTANFDDATLGKAIEYAHLHNVALHVTVNNLISDRELDNMRSYLKLLDELKPDALIVQDLSILQLAREMNLSVPLHASIMMNTHNEHAIRALQGYGISRVVVNREMSLSQLSLLKERTGIEVEYFIHGDMCISHSGQCVQSGVVFGHSSNRGRCLKPCRWPYQLVDAATGLPIDDQAPGPYKLAMKDMCLYMKLPELIQAGVSSFKIEGRMRTADFVSGIVKTYRKAIDCYIADPMGYTPDLQDWENLQNTRSRDFSTCYALGNPGATAIGYSGKREPRFFSQAVREADMATLAKRSLPNPTNKPFDPALSVHVADLASLIAACQNGANTIYIGGEVAKPGIPWTLQTMVQAVEKAGKYDAKVIITTPRITMERECGELEQFFSSLAKINPHGLMVGNLGALTLAQQHSTLPLQAEFSFNVFNHVTAQLLKNNNVKKATISLEATYEQIMQLVENSPLPLEFIVHGSLPAMITDHSIPEAVLTNQYQSDYDPALDTTRYALLDTAGQQHPIMVDQYGRSNLLFAKDLCLLPHLHSLRTVQNYRIEGQYYTPELVGLVTKIYREELDKIAAEQSTYHFDGSQLEKIAAASPRELGIGTFRYRLSK
ncbi:peptidase U32 family protein [Pelosinus baikalensis]|uniref:U32 family peptidase n=1 Tax=Pelosinus baikalensis TaxID=2892015 RepID=A0ABS8HP79_9FIRM|nr:U32 family peptidase [Pelosinus baikalensis]MCC5464860.1 U32 family peptidase [Pelosinus baikalensis]